MVALLLILQKYYGLSDERTEYEINDRLSFLSFLGLELGDGVPDARTIWDFKERIEAKGRNGSARLFETFTLKLSSEGLITKEGSIVDASFINVPRQRNSGEENARWAKKNNETYFGWKNHIEADAKTKLIDTQITTDASVHDSQNLQVTCDSSDERALADSAYHSEEHEEYVLKDCNAEEILMRKGQRNAPLSKEEEQ